MPALIILAVVLGIPALVIAVIYTVHFLYFLINVVGTLDFAPAFFHTGNVFAWIITIIALVLAVAILKAVVKVVRTLGILIANSIAMAVTAGVSRKKLNFEQVKRAAVVSGVTLLVMVLIFFILGIIGSVYAVSLVFDFTAENPGLTGTFLSGNILATIYLFLFSMSILAPVNANSSSDD